MITRLLGRDAEVDFSAETKDAVRRLEERFPAPEWAIVFQEAEVGGPEATDTTAEVMGSEPEDIDDDSLVLCRRYSDVLVEMVWISLGEIAELEADGIDWVGDIAAELDRTEAEIEAEEAEAEGEA